MMGDSFNALVRIKPPKFRIGKFNLKKLETSLYCMVHAHFNIWNRLGVMSLTDRWTDIIIANAMLNYVAWPKLTHDVILGLS